jgi:ribosomal protein L21E
MIIGEMKVMVNETSQYNIGLPKEIEYEKVIGKVVSKLKGIDAYAKTTAGYGKTPVNSSANHIYVTQYGKVDNTSKLKSILKKADPNLDVSKLKNNFNASDSARSKHDQDNDIWKYSIPKKMDWHQAKKAGILKTKPIKKMSHDVVIDLLDMMAPYTSKQHELADQEWTSLDSFMQHASDLISGSNWKKFQQSVKKKYPVLESVSEAKNFFPDEIVVLKKVKYNGVWLLPGTYEDVQEEDFGQRVYRNIKTKKEVYLDYDDIDNMRRLKSNIQIKESVNEAKNKIKPGTEIRWPSNHKNKSLAGRSGYVAKIKGSNALMNMHDNSNDKAMWIPVPIKDLPKAKESVNGDFPKQYAKAFAKATGNESVNEADLKLDYCGKCMQMTNQKDKKCQKCKKKNESVNEGTSWPKEVEAYDPDVIFKLVKDMGGKAKYDIVLKKNGKVIEPGGRVYKSLKSLEAEAGDYTRSKGGTQSSQFGESVSEGSESMEEDHIKINKDEMDTLHSTGKLDKDGHVIEYDDSLEEHVLRKLVNEELDNMFNEIQYRPQSGTKAGAIHSLPKKKYQLKKNTLVQLVNKQYVTLPKGTVISNLPGGLFAKHGTLKKFYKDAKDQKWGIMIVSREQTLQAIEDNSKVLESVNEAKNPFKKGNKVVVDKIVGMTHSRQSDAKRFNGKKGIVNSTQGDYVSVKLKGFRSSDIEFHMKELKLVESVNEAANPLMKSKEGLKTWWKHSKEDIMSFVYWTQKKMPPSNKSSYDKQWKLIVKQLHGKSPAPVSDYKKKMREKIVFYKDDDKKLRRFDTDQSKNT